MTTEVLIVSELPAGQSDKKQGQPQGDGTYIALGVAVGLTFGALFDNVAVGLVMGLAIGVAIDASQRSGSGRED